MTEPVISFVLLTWNSERHVRSCLDRLLAEVDSLAMPSEIFVVDNGSRDTTAAILREFEASRPGLVIPVLLDHNTGTTYSRNLALRRARGEWVCVMDSDVEVGPGTVATLIGVLEATPRVGLVAPRLVYPSGALQKSTDAFPTVFNKALRYVLLKWIERRENTRPVDGARDVDYAISAMWVFRREVLARVGLLDERIRYAPEDADYCYRIWQAGYAIRYEPAVTCVHHTQEISRGLRINRAMVEHVKGLVYYFRKHRYVFRPPAGAGAPRPGSA